MLHFVFGIHCHQPVGNFDFVFESAHEKSYYPFLKILSRYPSLKCSLHYSGILYDWIKKNKPETFNLIAKLTHLGQLEIMTGGYYEPILTTIPKEDQLGQIQMQTNMIQKEFNHKARGLWLTERIWEPHLPKVLSQAGVEYVTVDDSHLKQSGIADENLYQYFITEELGHSVKVFPISETLRYLIPFQEPQQTIDFLKSIDDKGDQQIIVLADDGEKFGDWPGTYEWVYEKKWLIQFFDLLVQNEDWLKTTTFSEVIDTLPPQGKVYMATASYEEMMGWALPTSKALDYKQAKKEIDKLTHSQQFLRGGFWRNFLVKYTESNQMYSKMQIISQKVNQMQKGELKNKALKELWQGQCNCAYWHGEFGGLYLNHLRNAIYQHLIAAELIADQEMNIVFPNLNERDYNNDGFNEILFSNRYINAYFSEKGGQLIELDIRKQNFNLLNTFRKQEETYHHILIESIKKSDSGGKNSANGIDSIHDIEKKRELGIEKHLNYDSYDRFAFIDHFFEENTTLDQIKTNQYKELGDFINSRFKSKKSLSESKAIISYTKNSTLKLKNNPSISLTKTFSIQDQIIEINYLIHNQSNQDLDLWIGIELNLTVLAGDANDRYYFSNSELKDKRAKSEGITKNTKMIGLKDEYQKVSARLEFNEEIEVWRFPIETVSQSVDAYELNYQASSIIPMWKFNLEKKKEKNISFKLIFEEI